MNSRSFRLLSLTLIIATLLAFVPARVLASSCGWSKSSDGTWHYVLKDGSYATGWKKISKKWYCFDSEGLMLTGFIDLSGKIYYLAPSGAMVTGWQKDDEGHWYYMKSSGEAVRGNWIKDGGKWYYLGADGIMVTGEQIIGGKLYIFGKSGAMGTGWQHDSEWHWYYFNDNGSILKKKWIKTDGNWYWVDANGCMATGLNEIGGKYYYFFDDGVMAANKVVDDILYGSSGAAAANPAIPLRIASVKFNSSSHVSFNNIDHLEVCAALKTYSGYSIYCVVAKDGENVYTSDVVEASEAVVVAYSEAQGAVLENECLAPGKYKFTFYTSDGEFIRSATSIVSYTAAEDEVLMKYSDENPPLVCMMTQSTCYNSTRKFKPKGILWHSTGVNTPYVKRYVQPDDDAENRDELLSIIGKNTAGNDWNHIEKTVGMNFWVGKLADGTVASVQTLPWDYRPWGCGAGPNGSGNDVYIQFEICEDNLQSKSYFNKCYREACQMTAYLCRMFDIDPNGTIDYKGMVIPTITDHTGSNSLGLGSNHADIQHWSTKYGKTMADVRADVSAILNADMSTVVTYVPTVKTQSADAVQMPADKCDLYFHHEDEEGY